MFEINNAVIDIEGRTLPNIKHLSVQTHKTVALIGRNGSGKTTLFKYIIENRHAAAGGNTVYMVPQIKDKESRRNGGESTKSLKCSVECQRE